MLEPSSAYAAGAPVAKPAPSEVLDLLYTSELEGRAAPVVARRAPGRASAELLVAEGMATRDGDAFRIATPGLHAMITAASPGGFRRELERLDQKAKTRGRK